MNRLFFSLLILLTILSCDSTSSIEPPDNSFFVKFYGGEGNQEGVDAILNVDGTITLFGTTDSPDLGKQLYLVNVEPNGRIIWETSLGGSENEFAKDIELTSDGRLVIVADVENTPGEHDILIMTLTSDGNVIDQTITGFSNAAGNTDEVAISVTQTNDGFLVAGSTNNLDLKPTATTSNDTRDALHMRYFDNLTIYPNTWRQAHGPGDFDEGVRVIQLPASQITDVTQFYFFGYSNNQSSDFNPYIIGLGQDGETTNVYNFLPGNPGTDELISSVIISPIQSGEGYLLAGISTRSNTSDIFIAKLRKTLSFAATDFQFQKNVGDLGLLTSNKTALFASANSGFFILSNERLAGVQNFYLTKIGNDGNIVWNDRIIFGGEMDDRIGSVMELPDGSLGIVGTFSIGQDGETKLTFIKVNREGKFSR